VKHKKCCSTFKASKRASQHTLQASNNEKARKIHIIKKNNKCKLKLIKLNEFGKNLVNEP
jgi:hypothetical protein